MSIFSLVGVPEPDWAKNFKTNVINPDPIPNPLVKQDRTVIAKKGTEIVDDIKKGVEKVTKDVSLIIIIAIVLFIMYMFKGKK
jgi:hypothetical protein